MATIKVNSKNPIDPKTEPEKPQVISRRMSLIMLATSTLPSLALAQERNDLANQKQETQTHLEAGVLGFLKLNFEAEQGIQSLNREIQKIDKNPELLESWNKTKSSFIQTLFQAQDKVIASIKEDFSGNPEVAKTLTDSAKQTAQDIINSIKDLKNDLGHTDDTDKKIIITDKSKPQKTRQNQEDLIKALELTIDAQNAKTPQARADVMNRGLEAIRQGMNALRDNSQQKESSLGERPKKVLLRPDQIIPDGTFRRLLKSYVAISNLEIYLSSMDEESIGTQNEKAWKKASQSTRKRLDDLKKNLNKGYDDLKEQFLRNERKPSAKVLDEILSSLILIENNIRTRATVLLEK